MDVASLGLDSNCTNFSRHRGFTTISCRATSTLDVRMKSKTNFYKVLSLESQNVGFEEIRKAYRSLALQYHPDVCPPSKKDESTRMFVALNRAYETLSNPALRREYDLEMSMDQSERFSAPSEFSRGAWEAQLHELMKRSARREREKSGYWRK